MFVKNFYAAMASFLFPAGSQFIQDPTAKAELKLPNGSVVYTSPVNPSYFASQNNCFLNPFSGSYFNNMGSTLQNNISWAQMGFYAGNGTTPVTFNDYRLAGETITGLSLTKTFEHFMNDNNAPGVNVNLFIVNGNNEPVTISEMGLFFAYQYHRSQTENSSSNGVFMVERTVLDTPVTIEPGGVGEITYTLKLNYPTA